MNSFKILMKSFPEADALNIERFIDEDVDLIVASPMRMTDGMIWEGMAMIGGLQDALDADYGIAVEEGKGNESLVARITELKKQQPELREFNVE